MTNKKKGTLSNETKTDTSVLKGSWHNTKLNVSLSLMLDIQNFQVSLRHK